MAFTGLVEAVVRGTLSGAPDIGSAVYQMDEKGRWPLSDGTGANQATAVFSDTRTLAASASEDLDLAGVLVGPLGDTLTFTAVKTIYVKAAAGNTNNVIVGGASSNAFTGPLGGTTPTITLPPNGGVLLVNPTAAGWTVTAGTGDLLKIANSAGSTSVSYDIVIIGEA